MLGKSCPGLTTLRVTGLSLNKQVMVALILGSLSKTLFTHKSKIWCNPNQTKQIVARIVCIFPVFKFLMNTGMYLTLQREKTFFLDWLDLFLFWSLEFKIRSLTEVQITSSCKYLFI